MKKARTCIWVSPITLGGYNSITKKFIDKMALIGIPTMIVYKGRLQHPNSTTGVGDGKLSKEALVAAIRESDLIGLSSSCNVNTMPYSNICCLEELLKEDNEAFRDKEIFAIAHGGMPYLDFHDHIVRIVEVFAQKKEMKFLGGLICGLIPLINENL